MVLILLACFTPSIPSSDVDVITFDNGLNEAPNAVLQPILIEGLLCPDNEPATMFAVYRTTLTDPAPIVVVFHSGAFDYVLNPDPADPLVGAHFQKENRLTADWARSKVFETVGLLDSPGKEPGEENTGALAAALVDNNAFAIYPANCWGDLWHNEFGYYRNQDDEGFERNGRYLAWAAAGLASRDATEAAQFKSKLGLNDLPIPLDTTKLYLIGLGDGGRAVTELAWRAGNMPGVTATIVDSIPDRMDWYTANGSSNADIVTGLERIYTTNINAVGNWSLDNYIGIKGFNGVIQNSLELYYSSDDPTIPNGTLTGLVAQATTHPEMTVVDTGQAEHVHINRDRQESFSIIDSFLQIE
jgi:hypothetical protein